MGSIVPVCVICMADQQNKSGFNVLVLGSFECRLESCVCLLPKGFLKVQRRASQTSRGWKNLFYERRIKCQICFSWQDEVKVECDWCPANGLGIS